jgi:hypothetical protein
LTLVGWGWRVSVDDRCRFLKLERMLTLRVLQQRKFGDGVRAQPWGTP